MRRPWTIVVVFVAGLLLGTAGLLTITLASLQLERQQARQQAENTLEDSVRLALWRLDAVAASLVGIENGRPIVAYEAFAPPVRAYRNPLVGPQLRDISDEVLVPSPLLAESPPFIRLHFVLRDERSEVPALEAARYFGPQSALVDRKRLRQQQGTLDNMLQTVQISDLAAAAGEAPASPPIAEASPVQSSYGGREWQNRSGLRQMSVDNQQRINNAWIAPEARPGEMQATWVGDELFLLRNVRTASGRQVQGCWIHWTELREHMQEQIEDLLPNATLTPDRNPEATSLTRRLASLPIRIEPGLTLGKSHRLASVMQVALAAAWVAFAIAALAIAGLLIGTVRLSERRAAFVSTVTHELRTPLTTFRLYTDLLEQGKVQDGEKQRTYLKTLRAEAERLGHLIENVLSYARLERGAEIRPQTIRVERLLDEMGPTLKQRTDLADAELEIQLSASAAELTVTTDPGAVERILFNLVDNACKYAVKHSDAPLLLRVTSEQDHLCLRLRDYGPGFDKAQAARTFSAFQTAADTSGREGIGLGLYLSRRLATSLGGTLELHPQCEPGAEFVLRIPSGCEGTGNGERGSGLVS